MDELPKHTGILESYLPYCERCGWYGRKYQSRQWARRALARHLQALHPGVFSYQEVGHG